MVRQQRGKLRALIDPAIEARKTVRHLLKAEDVGIASALAVETMRVRSTTPSQPLPHWMFQVISRITECPLA